MVKVGLEGWVKKAGWHSCLGRSGEQQAAEHGWSLGYVGERWGMRLGGQQYLDRDGFH